jgi:tetratricopeptide (TPR) repeat protein
MEEIIRIYEQAIELAESAGLLYHAARAHNNFANISIFQNGNSSLAVEHFQQAAELSRKVGNASNEVFCATNATVSKILLGNLNEAEEELAAQNNLLEAVHDPGPSEPNLKTAEVYLSRYRGELEEAIQNLRTLRHEAETVGDLQTLSFTDFSLGEMLLEFGDEEEAEVVLLEALELYDRIASRAAVATRSMLSMKDAQQGHLKEAHRWLDEARERETELGSGFFGTIWRLFAESRLAVAERNWPEAWKAHKKYLEMAEESGWRWYRAQALREWAEAHLTRAEPGDEQRARELLLESQEEFEEMGAPIYADQVEEILSNLE